MCSYVKKTLRFENRDSLVFLFELVVLNVVFKVAVGLFLTFNGYGFSVVAPPFSMFFASLDVLLIIGTVFLIDKISKRTLRLVFFHFLAVGTIIFLYANFVVYQYFRSFINFGLISFNGAGIEELMSYVMNDIWSQLLFLCFVVFSLGVVFFRKKIVKILFNRQILLGLAVPVSLGIFLYLATLGRAETGKLVRNPTIDLIKSVVNEMAYFKDDVDINDFSPPEKLIFGHADSVDMIEETVEHDKVKNILIIMVESLSLEMTSILKPEERSFSVIDKYKDKAVFFDSYRTVFPGTSRSFIATNCGTLPGTAHETISNYMSDFKCSSIADVFLNNGYRTGFFASSMFTYDNMSSSDFVKGYETFNDYLNLKKKYDRDGKLYTCQVEDEYTAEETFSFMEKAHENNEKFFTFMFMYSTHYPYDSPYGEREKSGSVEKYRKAQAYVSDTIEILINRMEEYGMLKNTAVVITADHGEAFGKRPGVNGHGSSLNEEIMKIPMMIFLPGLKKGAISHRNGTHVDIAPTLTKLVGIERESTWQGKDLLDSSLSEKPSFIFTRASKKQNGIVDGNYKYIKNVVDETEMLFDLKKDPDEMINIADRNPGKVEKYRDISEKWAVYQQKWITSKK